MYLYQELPLSWSLLTEILPPFPLSFSERVGHPLSIPLPGSSNLCQGRAHPLPLRPHRAAILGSKYHSQATASGRAFTHSCWGTHMETELHVCYICAGASVQPVYALWLVALSLESSPKGPRTLCPSYGVPIPFRAFNPSPNSSIRVLDFVQCLAVYICFCFSQLLDGASQRTVAFCKHSRVP